MAWKVFNIESGLLVKAGFETEDDAREWFEMKMDDSMALDMFDIGEMDEDEEAAYSEQQEDDEITDGSDDQFTKIASYEEDNDEDESLVEGLTEIEDPDY
jgi:hypothetical protein